MTNAEKAIIRASKTAAILAKLYKSPRSAVVWIGKTNFIIVVNGEEIRINAAALRYQIGKEEARAAAIEWQLTAGDRSDSYGELYEAQQKHEKAARRFGLVREFRENGII